MTLIYTFFIYCMLIFSFQLNDFAIVMLGEFLKNTKNTPSPETKTQVRCQESKSKLGLF